MTILGLAVIAVRNRRLVDGRLVDGRLVDGRLVDGRLVDGDLAGEPDERAHVTV